MAGTVKTSGNEYLAYMLLCIGLCIWAIKDGWFPASKTLEKHPRIIEHAFQDDGLIESIAVSTGQLVDVGSELARMTTYRLDRPRDKLNREIGRLRHKLAELYRDREANAPFIENVKKLLDEKNDELQSLEQKSENRELRATDSGEVTAILKQPRSYVESGETVVVVDPRDSFYLFNKSLSVLSLVGAVIFGFLYRQWRS